MVVSLGCLAALLGFSLLDPLRSRMLEFAAWSIISLAHRIIHGPLRPPWTDSGIVMVDGGLIFGFLLIFDGVWWKWGFWCIPSSVFGLVQPCRRLFFLSKTTLFRKKHLFEHFQLFFHKNGPNLLLTWGTTIKTGILTPVEFWWVP